MRNSILKIIGLAIAPCVVSTAHGEDLSSGAVLNFEYLSGDFGEKFVDWVARYGARAPLKLDGKTELEDLVVRLCGEKSDINSKLFRTSLHLQKVPVHKDVIGNVGSINLPPCLPTPKISQTPRVVLPNEAFWNYYKDEKTSNPSLSFSQKDIKTVPVRHTATGNSANTDLDKFEDWESADTTTVARYAEHLLQGKLSETQSMGEMTWHLTQTKSVLRANGAQEKTIEKAIVDVLKKENLPDEKIANLEKGMAVTARRWGGAAKVPWQDDVVLAASAELGESNNYFDQVAWIEPNAGKFKSPTSVQPGDLIVSRKYERQYVQVAIDPALLPDTGIPTQIATLQDHVPISDIPVVDSSAPKITPQQTLQSEDVGTGDCKSEKVKHWGNPEFVRMFRDAAIRSRILSYRKGNKGHDASLVIIDSGFIKAAAPGAYRHDIISIGAEELRAQEPSEALEKRKRAHGTAVAGLAIGGPDLWGLTSALGLNVNIRPASIFRTRFVADRPTPTFDYTLMKSAVEGEGDIFNLSFTSVDEFAMKTFRNDFLGATKSKLFIVAAGNKNMNNDTQGVDVSGTDLHPQIFGGNETGPNLILVAALDGNALASFSNYSSKHVSIAAPGCAVSSWKPADDISRYEVDEFSGTSFAAPIVAYTAAIVRALMPPLRTAPKWVRARLLASADLTNIKGVEDGRILNPVKAVSVHEDVVEYIDEDGAAKIAYGQLQLADGLNDLCTNLNIHSKATLLKFATDPTPEGGKESIVYSMRDGVLNNRQNCARHKNSALTLAVGSEYMEIPLKDVRDIVFRVN